VWDVMDDDTRSVVLPLVVIILACIAIYIGIYAADLMNPSR